MIAAYDTATRFHIDRRLGAGAFGVVYEAFDHVRNRSVALKTLSRADAPSVMRFKREFRSLAELRHPNLASMYELLMVNGEWALSMELVRGKDLLEHLSIAEIQSSFLDRGTSPGRRLSAVYLGHLRNAFRQLAEAIAFLHANGVVHRDIKPSNVMIASEGRVALLDFGMAIEVSGDHSIDRGMMLGTPGYMSPEQIKSEI